MPISDSETFDRFQDISDDSQKPRMLSLFEKVLDKSASEEEAALVRKALQGAILDPSGTQSSIVLTPGNDVPSESISAQLKSISTKLEENSTKLEENSKNISILAVQLSGLKWAVSLGALILTAAYGLCFGIISNSLDKSLDSFKAVIDTRMSSLEGGMTRLEGGMSKLQDQMKELSEMVWKMQGDSARLPNASGQLAPGNDPGQPRPSDEPTDTGLARQIAQAPYVRESRSSEPPALSGPSAGSQ
jgi:hypothetical protein